MMHNTRVSLFKNLTVFELVFVAVVSVALGVSFWGWTFVYEFTKPFLKVYGLNYLSSGLWILSSVLLSAIIQKPGVGILASLLAALVESFFTHWGLMSLVWGLVQGVGAEVVFLIFMYRNFKLPVLIFAAAVSSIASYFLDYFMYDYGAGSIQLQITQLLSFIISSILLAGVLSKIIIDRLLSIGLLNKFKVAEK